MLLLGLVYLVFVSALLLIRRWARPLTGSLARVPELSGVFRHPFSAALLPAFVAGDLTGANCN